MYDLPYYKAGNNQDVIHFMHQNPFAILTGCDALNKPVATHLPLLFDNRDGKMFLLGHVMKQTDHHKAFVQNADVLAIFTGPHTHVSASWYTNPQQASTWNYMTVHARGKLKFLGDAELHNMLTRLTAHFENDPQSPSLVEKMPAEYVSKLMKAIEAFEIEVTELDHVFKLSQNKDKESYHNIINELAAGNYNAKAIADEMRKRALNVTGIEDDDD